MTSIGLFYGTNTGYTEIAVDLLVEEFEMALPGVLTVHDVSTVPLQKMHDYDYLIVGCPTWNVGQLQDDWDEKFVDIAQLDLRGKKMAIFGLGDQYGYSDNYCDAIGILGKQFAAQGAEIVDFTSAEGYDFVHSLGVRDGQFMGLALDEDHQSDKSPARIADWVWQLVDEFDLIHLLDAVMA